MNSVLGVIVIYNIKLEQSPTFLSLSKSLKHTSFNLDLLVYDNSPYPMYSGEMHDNWIINYVHDSSNPGVSKAYNYGLQLAKNMHKDWILLLDQDTKFPLTTCVQYNEAISITDNPSIIAPILKSDNFVLSPYKSWYGHGKAINKLKVGKQSLKEYKVINSGMMIRTQRYEECGGYNEDIKLDFSDLAFLINMSKVDNDIYILDMVCNQSFFHLSSNHHEQRIQRFVQYCHDLNGIYKQSGILMYKLTGFLRAVKLSLINRELSFLKRYCQICLS